jgi:predicted HNH restriction endonuclease
MVYHKEYYETFKRKHPNYNKEQYRKHKAKKTEYARSHKAEHKILVKRREGELMEIIRAKIGSKCFVCNISEKIHYHEIHGKRHRDDKQYIANHVKDFIPLCCYCHHLVHKIARRNLSIKKIARIVKRIRIDVEKLKRGKN